MLESPKYNEKTEEHIRVKKAIRPKDGTIFDFMIWPPNNESEVVKSPFLDIPEPEVKRFPMENNDIISENTEAKFSTPNRSVQFGKITNWTELDSTRTDELKNYLVIQWSDFNKFFLFCSSCHTL